MDDLRYQVDLLTAMNQKLVYNEKMYKRICENSKRAIIYIDLLTGVTRTVGRWDEIFNLKISEVSDLPRLLEAFSSSERGELERLIYIEREGQTSASYECKMEDERTWLNAEITVYYDDNGNPTEKVLAFSDITKNKIHRDELTYLAYYDSLTGLYNRNFFITRLKEFIDEASVAKDVISVMLIDVDDFHKISDSRGIVIGDEVVQNIGIFIQSLCEEKVIASRFDSDIFCIAIYDPCGHRGVDTIYRLLKEYLAKPIRLTDSSEISVSVSIGVSEYPETSDNVLQLINCAEVVMLKAKDSGKDNIKFFDSLILNKFLEDVELDNRLKEAVHNDCFYINYQPQFNANTKKLRGVEALVRWKDSDGNVISPATFIPLAERNGTIISIGDFVLEESIRTFMEWKIRYDYDMTLCINISSIQYNRADFVPKIISLINKYGMDPGQLELEITESVLIDDLRMVTTKMYELGDYGIKMSLDDFGTGFSSLSYLKGLPIDTLKIDKTFIDNVTTDEASRVITETIITMAKKLGFVTVAEGVESVAQLEYLSSISCDLIQGYLLGKPMDKNQIEELLLRNI